MTVSIGGTATPVMGGNAAQSGGELFKGLNALGSRVGSSLLFVVLILTFLFLTAHGSSERRGSRKSYFRCQELSPREQIVSSNEAH